MKANFYAGAALVIAAISGCAGSQHNHIREAIDADARKGYVIGQICFASIPTDSPPKDSIQMEVVKHDSLGKDGATRIGLTGSGQSVYENYTATQSRLKALVVHYRPELSLVFEPPKILSFDGWSEWESAKFSTTYSSASAVILFDRPLHKYLAEKDALRARYRLMQFEDYLKYRRARAETIPPC